MNQKNEIHNEPKCFELAFYIPVNLNDIAERLSILSDLGIKLIGLDGFYGWDDAEFLQKLVSIISGNHMQVVSMHSPFGICWTGDDCVQRTISENSKVINAASQLTAYSTVWHMRWLRGGKDTYWADGFVMDTVDFRLIDSICQTALVELDKYADQMKVELNVENLPFVQWASCDEVLKFIRKLNLKNIGFTLDSGHSWLCGENPADIICKAGHFLKDTHFHDCLRVNDISNVRASDIATLAARYDLHAPVGLGDIRWADIIRSLWKINYSRPIVFEGIGLKGHPNSSLSQWRTCVKYTIESWRMFEDVARYSLE